MAVLVLLRIAFFMTLLLTSTIANDHDKTEDGGGGEEIKVDHKAAPGVTYDGRSLIINGKRELLFAGSIHYPRSTPDIWPDLMQKAKHGGLNVIDTYVFWNVHEAVQGKYNFEGRFDLVKFIKMVQDHGMYAILRIGPFIQGEWNHGGLPYWLREVPNITFRSDNEPWKNQMKKFVKFIVDKMKDEKLFASQGGPIITAQIENEYNTIQQAFRERGESYIQWAAKMAVGMDVGVPWIMCKQKDAPDPVINTCNGRHCGDTFVGPNKHYKPIMWTENWTAQYRVFGDPPSQRSAEDLSYAVARFFSKNGSLVNYYMYHGGTNFGRTSAAFTTTRYYDEAPLDEYGLQRDPKWAHLKDLHKALNLCKRALFWGTNTIERPAPDQEVIIFEQPGTSVCAAFLANNDTKQPQVIKFRDQDYHLPPRSISILPDCKTVVYNTQRVTAQHNARNFVRSPVSNTFNWQMYKEFIPTQLGNMAKEPMELYGLAKDTSDYAWFTTTIEFGNRDLPFKKNVVPVLRIASLGHGILVFVNGEFIGAAHGSKVEKSFVFQKPVHFKTGPNKIALCGYLVGLPDSGAYMEHRFAGPRSITILGLNTGTLDLTQNGWGHQAGLDGEMKQIYTEQGSQKVQWTQPGARPALTWYKGYFEAPEGRNPMAIRLNGMGKGMVWINGESIGRYWMSYFSPLQQPSQSEYLIPRAFVKPTKNLIVVLEEEPGDPKDIEILVVDRDTICSTISERHPPSVRIFESKAGVLKAKDNDWKPKAQLICPNQKNIVAVEFASLGDPFGPCGSFAIGNCTYPDSQQVVEKHCLGKPRCTITLETAFDLKSQAHCPNMDTKTLAVQVKCG